MTRRMQGNPVHLLSERNNRTDAVETLKDGTRGHTLKKERPELLEGIRKALNGGTYVSRTLSSDNAPPDLAGYP